MTKKPVSLVIQIILLVCAQPIAPVSAQLTLRDCPDCPDMIVIPAGNFIMGAADGEVTQENVPETVALREAPARWVKVEKPFAMGVYEITRDQFAMFVTDTSWADGESCLSLDGNSTRADIQGVTWRNPGITQSGDHPVVCVDYADVVAYISWLSIRTGFSYRLPSEAEWEYAARAGMPTPYFWGNNRADACAYANVSNKKPAGSTKLPSSTFDCDDGYLETAPVGSFTPNSFGLHDMIGNVWEWIEDCWHPNYSGAPSGSEAWTQDADCNIRVVRGGSWSASQTAPRAAARSADPVVYRGIGLGFRIARDVAQ